MIPIRAMAKFKVKMKPSPNSFLSLLRDIESIHLNDIDITSFVRSVHIHMEPKKPVIVQLGILASDLDLDEMAPNIQIFKMEGSGEDAKD